jgi:hypothetical protein
MSRVGGTVVADRWSLRRWTDTQAEPPRVLLANDVRVAQANIVGDLLAFRPGQIDRVLHLDDENVAEATTDRLDLGNGRSLVRGALWWLIVDDHVVTCSTGLTISALERFLTWLLQNYCNHTIEGGFRLTAAVGLQPSDLDTIKEITIGEQLVVHPGRKTRMRLEKLGRREAEGETDSSRLWAVLRALAQPPERADRVLRGIPEDQKVKWTFSMKFLRASPDTSREALADAHALLSELPNGPAITLQTSSGTVLGDDLVLVEEAEIDEVYPGLLDRNQVFAALQRSLRAWRAAGRVENDE